MGVSILYRAQCFPELVAKKISSFLCCRGYTQQVSGSDGRHGCEFLNSKKQELAMQALLLFIFAKFAVSFMEVNSNEYIQMEEIKDEDV
jgi:hypothetical protein